MKKIILIVIAYSLQLIAQNGWWWIMDSETSFNPLTFDANTLALFDGDLELTTSAWNDQTTNGYDIALANTPTVVSNAINGHQAIRLNGTDEKGTNTSIASSQPFTVYVVLKQITWTNGDIFLNLSTSLVILQQFTSSPNVRLYAGAELNSNPDLAVGSYGIFTLVINGATSEIRTNSSAAVTGDAGATTMDVLRFGNLNDSNFANAEYAYLIIRSGADNTSTQNLFINYLKERFGL